ncbi:integrative and conjugative element protein (TIGR02256 family) [Wenyingzhuangia heitensis]|uniref:Integrative and conjugative element protein (TIGR02256 family) n=1 Tax=Wenyingzhuangia heitensis TaxID=1487859 RepID=A0ABX0UCX1_9FLAO|nr:ThiF family adenylyltransferase [Wenyingzhuangia heitensis]NIJ46583.1 integrative and conjugative element protein (TIGR02256 family) [Wenyingzhuangia heitensis]
MKDEDKTLSKINGLLKKDEDLVIVENIKKEDNYYRGKIEINYLNENLSFDIAIPHNYPLTHPNSDNISIIFKNKNYIGLNHINLDGSVCFHPDKDEDFDRKLLYEIHCLKQWIKDYYIYKKEDDNYTYLIHKTESGCINKLYFTNTKNNFPKNSFGTFRFSIFSDEKFGEKKLPVKKLFRLGFEDGKNDTWSHTFVEELKSKTCKKGLYYFIEEEPLRKNNVGRKGIENWNELKDYLLDEFIGYLYKGLKREFNNNYYHENGLFLIIGYKIPNKETYEEHWDLIRISKKNIPIDYKRISKSEVQNGSKRFEHNFKLNKINWSTTENIDYNRFFGRGKLDDKITNSNILIIGCGALGSSLAEILVRGGVKNIVLEDFDTIKGGNLCRANYGLNDMIYYKTDSLTKRLKAISPFVNINSISVKLNHYDLEVIKDAFNKNVDIIFDCSTDTEVSYIIDKLNFTGKTFSLAITNNAKSFVSITGKNLTKQAKTIFDFVENEEPSYFEGTGCGYPTFEANYNDINALLNVGVKVINNNYSKNKKHESFIIQPDFGDELIIEIQEYEYYILNDINSAIHISKSVLKRIEEETKFHYPKEFGGVFIGYKSDLHFIITDILIPDQYKNGQTIFIREPGTLNERLSEIHKMTNGEIEYLGEWHSHPNGPTTPSSTDINAMEIISKDKNINIDKPLLMIAEVNNISFGKDLYIYDNKKLKKYE